MLIFNDLLFTAMPWYTKMPTNENVKTSSRLGKKRTPIDQVSSSKFMRNSDPDCEQPSVIRNSRSIGTHNNHDGVFRSNQPFPGAERIPASPHQVTDIERALSVQSLTTLNGPSMLPGIIEATAVAEDEHEQLRKERERLRDERRRLDEERQQYLHQPASRSPLVYATAASVHQHDSPKNTETGHLCFGEFARNRKWVWIVLGCFCIAAVVSVVIALVFKLNNLDSQPVPNPMQTPSPSQTPQFTYSPSQSFAGYSPNHATSPSFQ
jgi:hypothetical protein